MPSSRKLGYIGLGAMGLGMALNLLRAGHELTVYDVRADAMVPLTDEGAAASGSPAELAARCDVVHVNVRTAEQVEEVLFGEDGDGGVIGNARPGTIVLIHSTVPPEVVIGAAERAEKRSIRLLDAPVVGGGHQAANDGTLTVILGGDRTAIDECADLMAIVGAKSFVVGGPGTAQVAKMVNNVVAVINGVVIAEALALAASAGLDEKLALDIINAGSGASFLSTNRDAIRAMLAASDMKSISAKDLAIALAHAREIGVKMPVAALATQYSDAFLN